MSEAPVITDYTTYNNRMELSMLDKLFFLDKIQAGLIVDFGCANGALLKAIQHFNGNIPLIGYDNDPNMAGVGDIASGRPITDNWDIIRECVVGTKRAALVLSSVLHEVCHYGSKSDIDTFWSQVFETGFEYIVIRDMVPGRSIDRPSHINDVKRVYGKFLGSKALNEFEAIWGSIENNKQLVHFLLKYKYLEPNWVREVRENYMPINREALLAKIPENYDVIFHEHYVLPYIFQSVKDDVGIEIKDPTHLKLILRKSQ
jgi:hypothetical protein